MSSHGQTIVSRMIEEIDGYMTRRTDLRRLVDDLGAMYQSLDSSMQRPEREWHDAFVPLDRLIAERDDHDSQEIRGRIDASLGRLRNFLAGRAAGLSRAGR